MYIWVSVQSHDSSLGTGTELYIFDFKIFLSQTLISKDLSFFEGRAEQYESERDAVLKMLNKSILK